MGVPLNVYNVSSVSAVVWLSGAQAWCLDQFEVETSLTAGLLFVVCGVAGAWLARRLFF